MVAVGGVFAYGVDDHVAIFVHAPTYVAYPFVEALRSFAGDWLSIQQQGGVCGRETRDMIPRQRE